MYALVVRPHQAARAELHRLLTAAGIECREAASGRDAVAAAREARPDVVLLDVELPDGSGYEACQRLRDEHGELLPIIFISAARTHALDRVAGLLIGADDYIGEPFDEDELVARTRRAAIRSGAAAAAIRTSRSVSSPLTAREQDVLALLADGLSQHAIASELVISPKTVATHIQRILAKLGAHSRAEAIAIAYRDGIVAAAPPLSLARVR
jgi:two-component system nitrate/nitrite response regulator NarL